MKRKATFLIACILIFLSLTSCENNREDKNDRAEKAYLSEICKPTESFGVNVYSSENAVSMGGKDYFGGIVFGDLSAPNENCRITFPIEKGIKNISFYLGSTHYSGAYVNGYETVSVYLGEEKVLERTVYNHDLPEFCVIPLWDSESISFETESENIITAVGELTAWEGDVKMTDLYDESENGNSDKLMYNIKPYFLSGGENIVCAYSEKGETVEMGGEEYTDAIAVYLPEIEKWSNEYFAYFNLEKKYSYLSFKAALSKTDENEENLSLAEENSEESEMNLAKLSIYCDDKLVFSESFSDFSVHEFRLSVDDCGKLCFLWESIPSSPPLKMSVVSIYAEK